MAPSFYIETYGCQMNLADSALVERLLLDAGFCRAAALEQADVILLNTCTVRGHAEDRVLGRFRSLLALRGRRPRLVLGMLGCLAQHKGEELFDQLPFLDVIAGPDSYRRLPTLLAAALQEREAGHRWLDVSLDRGETYADLPGPGEPRATGFVTVQRGCDRFCAYCIVPLVRGRERAVPPDAVLCRVRELLASGAREVTLLGQTVNSYRHGDIDFAALLRRVLALEGLARLRFLSPHPLSFSDALCALIGEQERIMPHLHLPVQSGSSRVLAAMGRQHTREDYVKLVERLRAARPGLKLSTDILVGFPGESEADFEETIALLAEVRFQTAYMYRYSARSGTRAAHRMPDTMPEAEKLRRLQRVIDVQEAITRELFAGYVGQEVEVLVEGPARRDPQAVIGRSREDVPVIVEAAAGAPVGTLLLARVLRSTGHTLIARSRADG